MPRVHPRHQHARWWACQQLWGRTAVTRCRATPALHQSADETLTPASRCLPLTCFAVCPLLDLVSGWLVVHARGAIPNEVGPARCRATPASSNHQQQEEENHLINLKR